VPLGIIRPQELRPEPIGTQSVKCRSKQGKREKSENTLAYDEKHYQVVHGHHDQYAQGRAQQQLSTTRFLEPAGRAWQFWNQGDSAVVADPHDQLMLTGVHRDAVRKRTVFDHAGIEWVVSSGLVIELQDPIYIVGQGYVIQFGGVQIQEKLEAIRQGRRDRFRIEFVPRQNL